MPHLGLWGRGQAWQAEWLATREGRRCRQKRRYLEPKVLEGGAGLLQQEGPGRIYVGAAQVGEQRLRRWESLAAPRPPAAVAVRAGAAVGAGGLAALPC